MEESGWETSTGISQELWLNCHMSISEILMKMGVKQVNKWIKGNSKVCPIYQE